MSKKEMNDKLNNKPEEAKENQMALDDAARVKVLSPAMLVFKRFIRNKLAILGTCVLVILFLFCFLGPLFYPYTETEIFYGYRDQNGSYAYAQIRKDFVSYWNPECDSDTKTNLDLVERMVNSAIKEIVESGSDSTNVQAADGHYYTLKKFDDEVYALTDSSYVLVADFAGNMLKGIATFRDGYTKPEGDFDKAAAAGISAGSFEFGGLTYDIVKDPKGTKLDYDIYCDLSTGGVDYYFVSTVLAPTFYSEADYQTYSKDSGFKYHAYLSNYTDSKSFEYGGEKFTTASEEGVITLYKGEEKCAYFSAFAASGKDSSVHLSAEFQQALEGVISEMRDSSNTAVGSTATFTFPSPKYVDGKVVTDAEGNTVLEDKVYTVKTEQNDYTVWCDQSTYVILIYDAPNADHLLGTDANGMDVLARIMYGGRISLMVGFVVVFIEMILGVIMGGIAGYFGGWVDNLIMRLVDIFYCIPSMPILIITGAMFDALKMDYKVRLIWMMAILGLLGWAGVARMVRGQILSLREQEFMVAAEASGLSTSRRIFRHLVPNVMPQLIVQATMGLGSVIITESTLSFLGLGVKHPLATWGNMMNNITQKVEYLSAYAYIWVPIGCLICLAVIAFNFVGDGLRDAFDPKMKR